MRSLPYGFFNIVYNPLIFTLKVSVLDLTCIRRLVSLERSEPDAFIFLNVDMFVVKLTDLIPENKLSNRIFLWNLCPDADF